MGTCESLLRLSEPSLQCSEMGKALEPLKFIAQGDLVWHLTGQSPGNHNYILLSPLPPPGVSNGRLEVPST